MASYTSSEEEKILYLRKFVQNIKNNNEGPQLLEGTAGQHVLYRKVVRMSSLGSTPRQFFPALPTSQTGLLIPLKKHFYSQC